MTNFINKYKNLLKGLLVVLLTIAFAGSVRYLAIEDNGLHISEGTNSVGIVRLDLGFWLCAVSGCGGLIK
jgi:hypothetical protein